MATWPDVSTYVHANYIVHREPTHDLLGLEFGTGDDRTQLVYLRPMTGHGQEWLWIASFVGDLAQIDVPAALELSGNLVGAGLQQVGDSLVISTYQLLATIDAPEIDLNLSVVALAADGFEEFFTGRDEH